MKSRMDKYYKEEELMQRTSKNDFLYDELYKEKQMPNDNITVIDNVNEIDITKIKSMIDKREDYKRTRDYNSIISNIDNYKNEEIEYDFNEVDSSNYDINEILKKKRSDNVYEEDDKVRRISNQDYELMSNLEEESNVASQEKQLRDLYNTITKTVDGDLFANLKEDETENIENETETVEVEKPKEEDESTFYTSTSKFDSSDFGDDTEKKSSSTLFIVIAILTMLIAIGLVVYVKFMK